MATKLSGAEKRDRFHLACGEATRAWAHLESILWTYLGMLLGIDDQLRVRVLWATLPNYQARRKLLNRLAETYLDDSVLPMFRKLMSRMSRMAHKRNLIAHAMGDIYEGIVIFISDDDSKDDTGFNFLSVEKYQLENVKNWADDITQISGRFLQLYPQFASSVHKEPKMHRVQQSNRDANSCAGLSADSSSSGLMCCHVYNYD